MEMISFYLKGNHLITLRRVIEKYKSESITCTPELAEMISEHGITRHDFKPIELQILQSETHSYQEKAQVILEFIIFAIDMQEFKVLDDFMHDFIFM